MRKIILASASPRRKYLLQSIGLDVKVVPSNIDEKFNPRLKGVSQAEALSIQKADVVAEKYPDAIIIAGDTLVLLGDEILGKPSSVSDGKLMLRKLSGKMHRVVTGYTVVCKSERKKVIRSVVTNVYFKNLNKIEIERYLKEEKVLDKAGSYAIQGIGSLFVEKIEGDYSNVVGLPLFDLAKSLRKFGVIIY